MTRADEVAGGGDEADRAAEVSAAGRDRHVLGRVLVEVGAALADVDGALAGLADALDDRDHLRLVGVGREVVGAADRLPGLLGAVEDRRDREAQRGQAERSRGDAARRLAADRDRAAACDRLALEGARHAAVLRVPGLAAVLALGGIGGHGASALVHSTPTEQ